MVLCFELKFFLSLTCMCRKNVFLVCLSEMEILVSNLLFSETVNFEKKFEGEYLFLKFSFYVTLSLSSLNLFCWCVSKK